MITRIIFAILLLCTFVHLGSAQNDDGWVYKGEKDGVKVYLKSTGAIYDVKLTTSVQSSLSAICHLLADVESYPRWGYKISHSALLERTDEFNSIYYSRLDFPWPLSDRDVVLKNEMHQNHKGVITFHSKAFNGKEAETKDVIRLNDTETRWFIHPPKNGWVYVEYYIHSDPGGNVPDWLVNSAIDMGPRETINALRKELKKPQYNTIRLAYIKE